MGELEQAKEALITRDRFVAMVSHDIRTPLGVIEMCCTNLVMEDLIKSGGMEWMEMIQRNIGIMTRMITDLLDVEFMEHNHVPLKLTAFKIVDLVEEATRYLRPEAEYLGIDLRVEFSKLSLVVRADYDRILQVVSNLIRNALKFTPKGGNIILRVAEEINKVKICVDDDGSGVPLEQREKIFERFAQVDCANKIGVGLGLYISKMIITEHGGNIWVGEKDSPGSLFCFTLTKV